jgi:urocanate hydratase/very-short-patch-repair endonuclease
MLSFKEQILNGIPSELPATKTYDTSINHAPKRKQILSVEEKKLALRNALRYFDPKHHAVLAPEFKQELNDYGRIYMYRFRPEYEMKARNIYEYPHQSKQAAAIMHMIQNNLDYAVAQHPHELITYGGNGAVFQNWAQYLLTMQYLAIMTDEQTLAMYSGHPMGLFPSHKEAPRVVVTNGMMIPNYSKPDDWEKYNALGVTQYGQMTAGSYMYIGPQGIVHGTTITVMNAARKKFPTEEERKGKLFVTCGLGGMSGAQPKAAKIAGLVSITAEINPKAVQTRHSQKWVDEVFTDLNELVARTRKAQAAKEAVSFAYQGNIVDLWECLLREGIMVDIGSDQSSLHNPWAGGYYPQGFTLEDANTMMAEEPARFKQEIQKTLVRHINAVNSFTEKGMYFFDYGNAFLLEVSRAGGDVWAAPKPPKGAETAHPQPLPKGGEPGTPKFQTANPATYKLIKEFVDEHRKFPTEAESVFWNFIKSKKLENYKFRQQHIIGDYIADFVCLDRMLVIEIDGLIHQLPNVKVNEDERTKWLNEAGFEVMRFTNDEVLLDSENTLNKLLKKLEFLPSHKNLGSAEKSPLRGDLEGPRVEFRYNSYVQDILGPMCFDYGFGPFRWVCTSANPADLAVTDKLAQEVLEEIYKTAPDEIKQQLHDNIVWIKDAQQNNLVVGSQARILYADAEGRMKIAVAINKAIGEGKISAPVVLGRDHHDVSGTDSPYRETSNIYDGSKFTADMAVQNFVGDAFRGATWISLHNGGGVGWGEVMNGGFGLVLDGSADAERRAKQMLHWDVNNGISRRSWARNKEANFAIKRAMEAEPLLRVTMPNEVEDEILNQ